VVVKPFLKWAGGKFRILDKILAEIPKGSRFVEPFAGSCAVYLNIATEKALVCDINTDLIWLYKYIQSDGEHFIQYCKSFFTPENNEQEIYMRIRDRFNSTSDQSEKSAILLYLNRHSFNGLVRYNSKGGFNVPFGKYTSPYFPLDELRAFHRKTQITDTEFVCADFRTIFKALNYGDVVYCDPPYVPLSATASFTTYAGNVFSSKDQAELASLSEMTCKKGIPVILSNHDTEETRVLYASAEVRNFNVQRFISCKGEGRGTAPELLAIFK